MINLSSAGIFSDFGLLHKGAWVAMLVGSLLGVQDYKKVKFPGRDNSSLAVKGLKSMEYLARYIKAGICLF